MGVKRDNPNGFKDLAAKLEGLDSHTAKVGWFENDKEENNVQSAYVAAIQEYGVPDKNIPPRLGMRETLTTKQQVWKAFSKSASKKVLDGSWTGEQAVEAVGYQAHADLYKRINSNPPPPLSDRTKEARRRKGNTNEQTLVDTGRMLGNMKVLVEDA